MGLLSKLLGDNKDGNALLNAIVDKIEDAVTAQQKADAGSVSQPAAAAPSPQPEQAAAPVPCSGPWGGDAPPVEENLFTFSGSYTEYFDRIFRAEFPEYEITQETLRDGRAAVFTFTQNGRTALKVELLGQSSAAVKLRRDCAASGTPYLRYYYDHRGWWNTRSYVTERTRRALNG